MEWYDKKWSWSGINFGDRGPNVNICILPFLKRSYVDERKRLYLNTCTPFPVGLYLSMNQQMIVDRVFPSYISLYKILSSLQNLIRFDCLDNAEPRRCSFWKERKKEAICMRCRRRSACRQVAGVHVQRSARHHSHREGRVGVSFSLSSDFWGGKEVGGRRSNKSDSVHPFVRGRNSGKYRFWR